jgi:hypothetical protein
MVILMVVAPWLLTRKGPPPSRNGAVVVGLELEISKAFEPFALDDGTRDRDALLVGRALPQLNEAGDVVDPSPYFRFHRFAPSMR